MWLRLRQVVLLAEDLAAVGKDLNEIFSVRECYRDPVAANFGLQNALFPFGNQVLEVCSPVREDTAGSRYLKRRGGDGGYMVIAQCDDHTPRRARVEQLGIRLLTDFDAGDYKNCQLHPKDTGGSLFEIDEQLGPNAHDPDGPWYPAGPNWQDYRTLDRVTGIVAAELQCEDPAKVAQRWSDIVEIPLVEKAGFLNIELDNANLRFVPISDGRPEGLGGFDVGTTNRDAILAAADKKGAVTGESQVTVCGVRINLLNT